MTLLIIQKNYSLCTENRDHIKQANENMQSINTFYTYITKEIEKPTGISTIRKIFLYDSNIYKQPEKVR